MSTCNVNRVHITWTLSKIISFQLFSFHFYGYVKRKVRTKVAKHIVSIWWKVSSTTLLDQYTHSYRVPLKVVCLPWSSRSEKEAKSSGSTYFPIGGTEVTAKHNVPSNYIHSSGGYSDRPHASVVNFVPDGNKYLVAIALLYDKRNPFKDCPTKARDWITFLIL